MNIETPPENAAEATDGKRFTCMVIDDEDHAIMQITRNLEQIPFLKLLYTITNPVEALEILNSQPIDMVFMDVEMPYLNGIELARMVGKKTQIILCTAYAQYALEGFEVNAVDYLLKPVTYSRLLKAVNRAVEQIILARGSKPSKKEDCFFIKADVKHRLVQVRFDDVDYIERLDNYTCIHVNGEKKLSLLSLSRVVDLLPDSKFIRVHSSFIVPIANIAYVDANSLTLRRPSKQIPISEKYKLEVNKRLNPAD